VPWAACKAGAVRHAARQRIAPVDAQDRGRGASAEHQAPAQAQGKTPQDLLTQNPRLADNLSKLLPAAPTFRFAASGFRNLGEFVSAVHVSNNLGIPFADLKTRMLAGDSLGTAIHALKPEADAQVEVRKSAGESGRADEGLKQRCSWPAEAAARLARLQRVAAAVVERDAGAGDHSARFLH
jgi:hypothetical protein